MRGKQRQKAVLGTWFDHFMWTARRQKRKINTNVSVLSSPIIFDCICPITVIALPTKFTQRFLPKMLVSRPVTPDSGRAWRMQSAFYTGSNITYQHERQIMTSVSDRPFSLTLTEPVKQGWVLNLWENGSLNKGPLTPLKGKSLQSSSEPVKFLFLPSQCQMPCRSKDSPISGHPLAVSHLRFTHYLSKVKPWNIPYLPPPPNPYLKHAAAQNQLKPLAKHPVWMTEEWPFTQKHCQTSAFPFVSVCGLPFPSKSLGRGRHSFTMHRNLTTVY